MNYLNTALADKISYHKKGMMENYPDVFVYTLNQTQYTYLWEQVRDTKYQYFDGLVVRPTNFFMYWFQAFKGWLGFDNNCQKEKITYQLEKLTYYGYTQQFTQPNFAEFENPPISQECIELSLKNYTESVTERFQSHIVKKYFEVEPAELSSTHRFGDSWIKAGYPEEVPILDPQNNQLIQQLVAHFDENNHQAVRFYKNSKFARISAQYFCNKAKAFVPPSYLFRLLPGYKDPRPDYLRQALIYKADLPHTETEIYVNFFLEEHNYAEVVNLLKYLPEEKVLGYLLQIPGVEQKKYIPNNSPFAVILANHHISKQDYQKAAMIYDDIELLNVNAGIEHYLKIKKFPKVIALLDSVNEESKQLEILLRIPEKERDALISKDTPIAKLLAAHYIVHKKHAQAASIYSDIESLNTNSAFILAYQSKDYSKAYEIFSKHKERVVFSSAESKALAKIWADKGEQLYEEGKGLRKKAEWSKAEAKYQESLTHKKMAYELNPGENYLEAVNTHKRLYAQLLVHIDTQLFKPEESQLDVIQKALNLLKECTPKQSQEKLNHQKALARALMRRVDTLREKICLDRPAGNDWLVLLKEKKPKIEKELKVLISSLEEMIELLKDTKDKESLGLLGKAHFLYAETNYWFDLDRTKKNHYKKALESVPNNPFYVLICYEMLDIGGSSLSEAKKGLDALKFTTFDWNRWDNDRWLKTDKIENAIKDIHLIQSASNSDEPKPSGWFSFLSR